MLLLRGSEWPCKEVKPFKPFLLLVLLLLLLLEVVVCVKVLLMLSNACVRHPGDGEGEGGRESLHALGEHLSLPESPEVVSLRPDNLSSNPASQVDNLRRPLVLLC